MVSYSGKMSRLFLVQEWPLTGRGGWWWTTDRRLSTGCLEPWKVACLESLEGAAVIDSAYQGASLGILKGLANQQREEAGESKPGETKTPRFRELGSRTASLF